MELSDENRKVLEYVKDLLFYDNFNPYDIPLYFDREYIGYYKIQPQITMETIQNEYRKFIEENKYGRIVYRRGEISIPRIQCSESHGNNIKYDSRRFLDDMVK